MLEFPIPSKMFHWISEQATLINSPQFQQQLRFVNSPEYQEVMRLMSSPDYQEAMRLMSSPDYQEAMRLMSSPDYQEMLRLTRSPVVQKALHLWNSTTVQEMIQLENSLNAMGKATQESVVPVEEDTLTYIRNAAPLIPEESREHFEEVIAPDPERKGKLISAENLKWILGIVLPIIVSILLYILSGMTAEEQVNQLMTGNETLEKILELLDPDSNGQLNYPCDGFQNGTDVPQISIDQKNTFVAPDSQNDDVNDQG